MDYETLYFTLAAQVANAVQHLDDANYGLAKNCLIEAQQHCETIYSDMT